MNNSAFKAFCLFGTGLLLGLALSRKRSPHSSSRSEQLLQSPERVEPETAATLSTLATLTAGVAHELSTPLGTIAVVSADFERQACDVCRDGQCKSDARLIRTQVERCREILDRMRLDGLRDGHDTVARVSLDQLRLQTLERMHRSLGKDQIRWKVDQVMVRVRNPDAVSRATAVLLDNALDATEKNGGEVSVKLALEDRMLRIEVSDRGGGMSRELVRKVGTPFFTTKPPGHGLGLGIFLVKSTAAELGGQFFLESEPGQGTRAILRVPAEVS